MAGMSSDVELLKDIPGYKAILKSVLKSQIQLLVEQLSEHTGEETMILTASIHDGTLSHQGSTTGKGFLEGRDEIKSQFLGYCLKSHHKKKSSDTRPSPYQRPQTSVQGGRTTPTQGPGKKVPRLQVQPVSLQRVLSGDSTQGSALRPPDMQRAPAQVFSDNGQERSGVSVKLESSESVLTSSDSDNFASTSVTFPSSIHQSHTLTSGDIPSENNESQNSTEEFVEHGSENDDSATNACIKIEPITENEMELEITGVEPGKVTSQSDSWSHSQGSFGATPSGGTVEASSFNEASDSSYNISNDDGNTLTTNFVSRLLGESEKTPFMFLLPKEQSLRNVTSQPSAENSATTEESNNSHYKVKRIQCEFCLKWFAGRGVLNRHLLIHTGERPWQCTKCDKAFNRKGTLRQHMLLHMNSQEM